MQNETIASILEQLQRGELNSATAAARLQAAMQPSDMQPVSAMTENAHVDLDRSRRCGFPEVVYCEGKSVEAVVEVFAALHQHGEAALGTRIGPEQADAVLKLFPAAVHNVMARTIRVPSEQAAPVPDDRRHVGKVAVITAGTSDRPVAEEALETLRWMGCEAELIVDVGVAGPHRLGEHRDRFADAKAVVVVAGMEGALPSVVGGWVNCPVIAVPTSIGYGASFGGVAALLGMLNSCASNVTVVNIDAGFKGGYVAGLIARQAGRCESSP